MFLPVTGWKQVPFGSSLVAQSVKKLPAVEETQVQSLGQKDPLEKEMATHSNILAWKIRWAEEPGIYLYIYDPTCGKVNNKCIYLL